MSIKEQQTTKEIFYNEAIRYMNNANETLKKAGKSNNHFIDDKYVKTACGIAYNAVLKALDGYLLIKGAPQPKKRKSIEYYNTNVSKLDKKLMQNLDDVYKILHLSGYYDGITNASIIKEGFESAYKIINKIEP